MASFSKIFLGSTAVLCALLAAAPLVVAEDYTSTNFISRDPVMSDFGGTSTSTTFEAINTGGQTITGESASTNFLIRSGFLYFDTFTPKTQNWRWYDDESNETPTSALAAENVAPSEIEEDNSIKLRITVKETADIGMEKVKLRLQYSTDSNFSVGVGTPTEAGSCNGSSLWCYSDGGGSDNGVITTKVLSDASSCSGSVGEGCGTHNESGISASTFTHKKSAATEYEFTIKRSGAARNTTYFFRAYDVTSGRTIPLNAGETYPSLSTQGATLTFTVSGLTSGVSTSGITTDVTTTPTGIPFGALSLNAEIEAAQRLSVTTNADSGYQIYTFQTQGFLGSSGSAEIVPVDAVNSSPAAWSIPAGASGAYGYHTADATLAGGSSRFAAHNTYAKFETGAKEIAYSSGPVTAETTDLVYKTEITNQQPAGTYTSTVVYVIVPTF